MGETTITIFLSRLGARYPYEFDRLKNCIIRFEPSLTRRGVLSRRFWRKAVALVETAPRPHNPRSAANCSVQPSACSRPPRWAPGISVRFVPLAAAMKLLSCRGTYA